MKERPILFSGEMVKAEVERLNTWHTTISEAWKARAEKAEAAHIKDLEHIKARDDSFGVLLDSNIRLEEELARWKPLLEAVKKAWLPADHPVAHSVSHTLIFANHVHEIDILIAALAYKEQHET